MTWQLSFCCSTPPIPCKPGRGGWWLAGSCIGQYVCFHEDGLEMQPKRRNSRYELGQQHLSLHLEPIHYRESPLTIPQSSVLGRGCQASSRYQSLKSIRSKDKDRQLEDLSSVRHLRISLRIDPHCRAQPPKPKADKVAAKTARDESGHVFPRFLPN